MQISGCIIGATIKSAHKGSDEDSLQVHGSMPVSTGSGRHRLRALTDTVAEFPSEPTGEMVIASQSSLLRPSSVKGQTECSVGHQH